MIQEGGIAVDREEIATLIRGELRVAVMLEAIQRDQQQIGVGMGRTEERLERLESAIASLRASLDATRAAEDRLAQRETARASVWVAWAAAAEKWAPAILAALAALASMLRRGP